MRDKALRIAERVYSAASKLPVDHVSVKVVYERSSMVKFASSQPSVYQSWDQFKITVMMAKDERLAALGFETTNLRDIIRTLERRVKVLPKLQPSPYYAPPPEPRPVEPLEGLVDKRLIRAIRNPARIVELITSTASEAEEFAGMVELAHRVKVLNMGDGRELFEEATSLKSYLRAFIEEGSGQWAFGSTRLDLNGIERMVERALSYAKDSRRPKPIEPGRYDVVFSPMVFGNLATYLGWMSSALAADIGMSIFLKFGPGTQVASEEFTLLDVPRNPELPGATSFDDESVPTYDKPIIEKGVFRNFLHSCGTARRHKAKTTGNSHGIMPMPWNLEVKPGDHSEEELIREVKRGVLITNNWYTRLQNYVEGVFSTVSRDAAFLIEDGEIKHPVRRFRIADTLPNLLRNISAIGKKTYDIYWWEVETPTRTPFILARNLNITRPG